MKNCWPTIKKLLKAFEVKNKIYLMNTEMIYSKKLNKVCNKFILNEIISVDEYYKKYPDKKRKKDDKRTHVKIEVTSSFKQIDILLRLAELYKNGDVK